MPIFILRLENGLDGCLYQTGVSSHFLGVTLMLGFRV